MFWSIINVDCTFYYYENSTDIFLTFRFDNATVHFSDTKNIWNVKAPNHKLRADLIQHIIHHLTLELLLTFTMQYNEHVLMAPLDPFHTAQFSQDKQSD